MTASARPRPATEAPPVLGWKLDDGDCWVFVRAETSDDVLHHHPGMTYGDFLGEEPPIITRVPELDGTGHSGEVDYDDMRDHLGYWSCPDCCSWTAFGPCRHYGEEGW